MIYILHLAGPQGLERSSVSKTEIFHPTFFPQAYYLLICTTSKEDEESKPGLKEEWIA
jgi:hypothetical protein